MYVSEGPFGCNANLETGEVTFTQNTAFGTNTTYTELCTQECPVEVDNCLMHDMISCKYKTKICAVCKPGYYYDDDENTCIGCTAVSFCEEYLQPAQCFATKRSQLTCKTCR